MPHTTVPISVSSAAAHQMHGYAVDHPAEQVHHISQLADTGADKSATSDRKHPLFRYSQETVESTDEVHWYSNGPMLHRIQLAGVFPDSHTLVNMSLKHGPSAVQRAWQGLQPGPDSAAIQQFIAHHFNPAGSEVCSWEDILSGRVSPTVAIKSDSEETGDARQEIPDIEISTVDSSSPASSNSHLAGLGPTDIPRKRRGSFAPLTLGQRKYMPSGETQYLVSPSLDRPSDLVTSAPPTSVFFHPFSMGLESESPATGASPMGHHHQRHQQLQQPEGMYSNGRVPPPPSPFASEALFSATVSSPSPSLSPARRHSGFSYPQQHTAAPKAADSSQWVRDLKQFLLQRKVCSRLPLSNPESTARFSLIPAPHPWISPLSLEQDPSAQIQYWDHHVLVTGLLAAGMFAEAKEMVENLSSSIARFGHVPQLNRLYSLKRSHPPLFADLVLRVALSWPEISEDLTRMLASTALAMGEQTPQPQPTISQANAACLQWLSSCFPQMVKEYEFWMGSRKVPDCYAATLGKSRQDVPAASMIRRAPASLHLNVFGADTDSPRAEWYRADYEFVDGALAQPDSAGAAKSTATAALPDKQRGLFKQLSAMSESGYTLGDSPAPPQSDCFVPAIAERRWMSEEQRLSVTSVLPVDLNAFLYRAEIAVGVAAKCLMEYRRFFPEPETTIDASYLAEQLEGMKSAALKRRSDMHHFLFDHSTGLWRDIDMASGGFRRSGDECILASDLIPLWCGAYAESKEILEAAVGRLCTGIGSLGALEMAGGFPEVIRPAQSALPPQQSREREPRPTLLLSPHIQLVLVEALRGAAEQGVPKAQQLAEHAIKAWMNRFWRLWRQNEHDRESLKEGVGAAPHPQINACHAALAVYFIKAYDTQLQLVPFLEE